jgi:DNA polymerase
MLVIDCETRTRAALKAEGSERVAKDPSTEVVLWAVRAPEWPCALVFEKTPLERILLELRRTKQVVWSEEEPLELVHWSPYDRLMVQHCERWAPHHWSISATASPGWVGPLATRWIDLAAVSRTFGAPGQLDAAGLFWVGAQKLPGKALINRFSKPGKKGVFVEPEAEPVRWEQFRTYAGRDADLTFAIYERIARLEGRHSLAEHWPTMAAVERMNRRGLPIDRPAAREALLQIELAESELVARCEKRWGFKPSQREKVRAALDLPNVKKETLEAAYDGLSPEKQDLADIRLETAGAARKKLGPMLNRSTDADPRVRGAFIYHGAWTRRLTSTGVQAQNFVRSPIDPAFFDELAQAQGAVRPVPRIFGRTRDNIRGFIAAPKGHVFVAADYSAIELRVGAWLATEYWVLEALEQGRKLYAEVAGDILGLPASECGKGSGWRYDFGKMVALACIYQLGPDALLARCELAGIPMTLAGAQEAVKIYRQRHPGITRSWQECHGIFGDLIDAPAGTRYSALGGRVWFERHELHIRVVRPSGFAQYFFGPQFIEGKWPNGKPRLELGFIGKDRERPGMVLQTTHGGTIFQGITQGTAGDLMFYGMAQAEREGFPPIMSIHDEVVTEIADDGRDWVPRLCEILSRKPDWAEGLPVLAEGWQGPRFTKG